MQEIRRFGRARQGAHSVGEQSAAGGGWHDALVMTNQEGHAEFRLKPLDVATHSRLTDVPLASRFPEAAGAAYGDEASQRAYVHSFDDKL